MLEAVIYVIPLLFAFAPFILIIWFVINTTMELRKQSTLLEEINKNLKR